MVAGGKLLQRTVSRVPSKISQTSKPRDSLQVRSDRELGAFMDVGGGIERVGKMGSSESLPLTANSGLPAFYDCTSLYNYEILISCVYFKLYRLLAVPYLCLSE